MGVCGWVDGWFSGSMGGVFYWKIIKFCLKIYFVETPAPMGRCMGQKVGSGQMII